MSAAPVPFAGLADPFASLSHLGGALFALSVAPGFLRRTRGRICQRGVAVFLVGCVVLFTMSGLFHLLAYGSPARRVFRMLDHAAIWVMIAGTLTGVHLAAFEDRLWRWGMTAVAWACAAVGIVTKTVYFDAIPHEVGIGFYLGFGWLGLLSFGRIVRLHGFRRSKWLLYGGLVYTLGAVVEAMQWPRLWPGVLRAHELFHLAVVVGAAMHGYGIWQLADARQSVDASSTPG